MVSPSPPAASDVVDLSSTQTITGSKTFSSELNLKPTTNSSNTGGQINFHYNQSANTTSSIVENASGQIRLNGNLYLNGAITSSLNLKEMNYVRHSVPKGTIPTTLDQKGFWFGDNTTNTGYAANCVGMFSNDINTSNEVITYMRALKNESGSSVSCDVRCGVDSNGSWFTYAPTSSTTDNSTKIATTAFVNSRINSVKSLGSDYVMNISDFGTGAGYYRCASLDTSDDKNFICGNFGGGADVGDYRFLVEGMSGAYKNVLAFTPRSYEFYYGRFWNSEWQGWRVVPTVEEGTWTPNIYGSDTAGAFNYTTQAGAYVKIGRLVYIRGYLVGTCTTAPLGQVRIKGLPFTPTEASGTSGYSAATGGSDYSMKRIVNLFIGTSYLTVRIQNKSDNTIDYANFSSTSSDGYYIKMLVNDSITLQFSCVYVTNAR